MLWRAEKGTPVFFLCRNSTDGAAEPSALVDPGRLGRTCAPWLFAALDGRLHRCSESLVRRPFFRLAPGALLRLLAEAESEEQSFVARRRER